MTAHRFGTGGNDDDDDDDVAGWVFFFVGIARGGRAAQTEGRNEDDDHLEKNRWTTAMAIVGLKILRTVCYMWLLMRDDS